MTREPVSFDWSEGSTDLMQYNASTSIVVVRDAAGIYRGMFRATSSLQFCRDAIDSAKKYHDWKDVTDTWAAFPKWVRDQVSDKLGLRAVR